MNQLIKGAQRAALFLKDSVKATDSLHYTLQLSTTRLRSVDQWVLYDPSQNAIEKGVMEGDSAVIELGIISDLVAHSEIDFRSLKTNIRMALGEDSPITIRGIMERFPATQGLGSVVGYLALGSRYGILTPEQNEVVRWKGEDGPWRLASIPTVYFTREKSHEFV